MLTFHSTLPKGFLYWLTVFETPDARIQCVARDPDGEILFDRNGNMYHHTVTWEMWLKQETILQKAKGAKVELVTREDGQLALAVVS